MSMPGSRPSRLHRAFPTSVHSPYWNALTQPPNSTKGGRGRGAESAARHGGGACRCRAVKTMRSIQTARNSDYCVRTNNARSAWHACLASIDASCAVGPPKGPCRSTVANDRTPRLFPPFLLAFKARERVFRAVVPLRVKIAQWSRSSLNVFVPERFCS